jgi:hypothetical protein
LQHNPSNTRTSTDATGVRLVPLTDMNDVGHS